MNCSWSTLFNKRMLVLSRVNDALPRLSDDLSRLADASLRFDDALSRLAVTISRCTDPFSTFSDMRSNWVLSCSRHFFISLKRGERSTVISSLTLMVNSLVIVTRWLLIPVGGALSGN